MLLAETYSDTTADRRVRKSPALFERGRRDKAFEAVLHPDPHVVKREADDVNVVAGMNLSQLLAPSIRFVEHGGVVREHEDFVGRLYQFNRGRIDIADLSIFQVHTEKIVCGTRHLDEFIPRQLLDVLAAFRRRGVNGRIREHLQPRLRWLDFGFVDTVLTRHVVQRRRVLRRRHPEFARWRRRWTGRGGGRIHGRGTTWRISRDNRSRGNVFLADSRREGRRRHCERRHHDGCQSRYPRRSKITMKHLPLPPLLNLRTYSSRRRTRCIARRRTAGSDAHDAPSSARRAETIYGCGDR